MLIDGRELTEQEFKELCSYRQYTNEVIRGFEALREIDSEQAALEFRKGLYAIDELRSWPESRLLRLSQISGWSQQELTCITELRRGCRNSAARQLIDSGYLSLLKAGSLSWPRWWDNAAFARPLQPVVGVSLFETQAYLAWLNTVSGRSYRLPCEEEWEAAAKGPSSRKVGWLFRRELKSPAPRFAYGNIYSSLKSNTNVSGIGRTTPIGVYSEGRTPDGIYDMSGNVWEWTSSAWRQDYSNSAQLCDVANVVRGGCWKDPKTSSRTSSRDRSTLGKSL